MKQTGIILTIITAIMLLPAPVEYLARSDTLFPLLALTSALTLTAALIFALPARNRR